MLGCQQWSGEPEAGRGTWCMKMIVAIGYEYSMHMYLYKFPLSQNGNHMSDWSGKNNATKHHENLNLQRTASIRRKHSSYPIENGSYDNRNRWCKQRFKQSTGRLQAHTDPAVCKTLREQQNKTEANIFDETVSLQPNQTLRPWDVFSQSQSAVCAPNQRRERGDDVCVTSS